MLLCLHCLRQRVLLELEGQLAQLLPELGDSLTVLLQLGPLQLVLLDRQVLVLAGNSPWQEVRLPDRLTSHGGRGLHLLRIM